MIKVDVTLVNGDHYSGQLIWPTLVMAAMLRKAEVKVKVANGNIVHTLGRNILYIVEIRD